MPHVEGETLRETLNRETQLGVDEVVTFTGDVADALDYAHQHNVIHWDVKETRNRHPCLSPLRRQ